MKKDKSIDEMINLLEDKMAWFHGEEFKLEDAKSRFVEVKDLADEIEKMLLEMKNEIEVLAQDFA